MSCVGTKHFPALGDMLWRDAFHAQAQESVHIEGMASNTRQIIVTTAPHDVCSEP